MSLRLFLIYSSRTSSGSLRQRVLVIPITSTRSASTTLGNVTNGVAMAAQSLHHRPIPLSPEARSRVGDGHNECGGQEGDG